MEKKTKWLITIEVSFNDSIIMGKPKVGDTMYGYKMVKVEEA